jgi:hypothetical protein
VAAVPLTGLHRAPGAGIASGARPPTGLTSPAGKLFESRSCTANPAHRPRGITTRTGQAGVTPGLVRSAVPAHLRQLQSPPRPPTQMASHRDQQGTFTGHE